MPYIFFILMLLCSYDLNAQRSENNLYLTAPFLNIKHLKEEDQTATLDGTKVFRFGATYKEELNLSHFKYENNSYHFFIKTDGAYTLNVIFNHFDLKEGSTLTLKSSHGVHYQLSSKDVRSSKVWASDLISSPELELIYQGDYDERAFTLTHVIYGYRDPEEFATTDKAVLCIPNVNCPVGANYQDVKRGVVQILFNGNSYKGTGTLINTTNPTQKPYILTANHVSGLGASTVFRFNYESPNCFDQVGPTHQYLVGCSVKAYSTCSDFQLVELEDSIPLSYNPYYAGWDRSGAIPNSTAGIHHPTGAIKKISIDEQSPEISGYGTAGTNHWHILDWEQGVTLIGSSGSALFDPNKRIIGQLHGGNSTCGGGTTNVSDDYYGRLNTSWDQCGTTANSRLQNWLDPSNTLTTLDGTDPNPNNTLQYNLGITNNTFKSDYCTGFFNAQITLKNYGTALITTFRVNIYLNGTLVREVPWNGFLGSYQILNLELNGLQAGALGTNTYVVEVVAPNNQTDQSPSDNTLTHTFERLFSEGFQLELKTDAYPEESSFIILNQNDSVVYTMPTQNLGFKQVHYFDICLPVGCYKFVMKDAGGNGLCCSHDTGYYQLRSLYTGEIIAGSSQFFFNDTTSFCPVASIASLPSTPFQVYPNPSSDEVVIKSIPSHLGALNIKLINLEGQALEHHTLNSVTSFTLSLKNYANGVYFIAITSKEGTSYLKVIKN